jgi:phospholipid/cholesterol/gamma-HCH transport system permease protein
MGSRSLLLVTGGMAFFGAAMLMHGAAQARKVVGDLAVVGPAYFQLLIRELGPTLAGLLCAVRVAAATSAELASMEVTEQVDALRLSAGDPDSDLVLPRVLAGLIAFPALTAVGTAAAALTGALVATFAYAADGRAFLDASLVGEGDVIAFLAKAVAYGLAVPLVSTATGLAASGGPAAVGEATTRGVVGACMAVLSADLAVSGALFWAGL